MKANAVGKGISEVDRAYTAGFLDADGAIMATIEKHREKKFGWRIRVTVKITQQSDFILQWFLRKFKCGRIRRNRTTHDWLVRDQHDVTTIISALLPHLKVKAKQAKLSLSILVARKKTYKDLRAIARMADTLSSFNVRSKNRRKNFATMIHDSTSSND